MGFLYRGITLFRGISYLQSGVPPETLFTDSMAEAYDLGVSHHSKDYSQDFDDISEQVSFLGFLYDLTVNSGDGLSEIVVLSLSNSKKYFRRLSKTGGQGTWYSNHARISPKCMSLLNYALYRIYPDGSCESLLI